MGTLAENHGTLLAESLFSKRGRLTVIAGCMFSGKTAELIRLLEREEIAGNKVLVFKPSIDVRYGEDVISSHNSQSMEAISIPYLNPEKIISKMDTELRNYKSLEKVVVGIDEAQLFAPEQPKKLFEVVRRIISIGIRVIVAGLDLDFRGEPFGAMPYLLADADRVEKLTAICKKCGKEATRTQRLFPDGTPVPRDDPLIVIGDEKSAERRYEARCRDHHVI